MTSTKITMLALAGTLAALTAVTLPATPARASLAAHVSIPTGPCGDSNNNVPYEFARCTTTSQHGTYSGSACTVNHNYNAGGGAFNVYGALNNCSVRVWLHQFRDWSSGGWAYCISPGDWVQYVPSGYVHPYNIYISNNGNKC